MKHPDNEKREMVQGISRFYEMLWIERDKSGKIERVFDIDGEEVSPTRLHTSFVALACDGGFTYLGEFIAMDNQHDAFRKRALNLQRRKRNHKPEDYL